jgi:hypothetical protein
MGHRHWFLMYSDGLNNIDIASGDAEKYYLPRTDHGFGCAHYIRLIHT